MRRLYLYLLVLTIFSVIAEPIYAAGLFDGFGRRRERVQTVEETMTRIPFADEDDDKVPAELKSRRVFGQAYYAAVEVRMGAENYFPSKCDDNAGWRFLRFLGVNKDGTFSVTAKFTVGNASTEIVPLFSVTKSGSTCSVQAFITPTERGVQVTPFFLLDSSKTINVKFDIRYKQDLTFEVAKKWFSAFYGAATGMGALTALGINSEGITFKKPAVLSEAEYKQIEGSINGIDAQLNQLLGPVLSTQNDLSGQTAMHVEDGRGVWLHTGLGGKVNSIAGVKAANIALLIRPRISLLVDNQLVTHAVVRGEKHLVPNFGTLGDRARASRIFYSTKTKSLESFDTLKEADEALKEKSKDLPRDADINAWRTACGEIYSYLQRQYGLNEYDALAIAAALFTENADLDKANSFAKIGCRTGVQIAEIWPHTGYIEVENDEAPANCWNDLAKRAIVRERLDATVIEALAGALGSNKEERARILNLHLAPGAVLDDPHGLTSAASSSASIVDRLSNVAMEGHGFCYDSAEDLSSPLYQRGFLVPSGSASQVLQAAFEFENVCDKALSGRTPQVNRIVLLRLRDDDDEGPTSRTVERLINFNRPQCTSCMRKLRAALPQSYGRFQMAPACQ
jgi:hypothetical protein